MKNLNKLALMSICILIILGMLYKYSHKTSIETFQEINDMQSKPIKAILKGTYKNGKLCIDVNLTVSKTDQDNKDDVLVTYKTQTVIDNTCDFPLSIVTDTCCPSNTGAANYSSTVQFTTPSKNSTCYKYLNAELCNIADTKISGYICDNTNDLNISLNAFTVGSFSVPIEEYEGLPNVNFVTDAENLIDPPHTGFSQNAPFFMYLAEKCNASNYTLNMSKAQIIFNDTIISTESVPGLPVFVNLSQSLSGPSITITQINSTKFETAPPEFTMSTVNDSFLTYDKNNEKLKNIFDSNNYDISKELEIIINNKIKITFPKNVRYNTYSETPVYSTSDMQTRLNNIIPSNKNVLGLGFLSNLLLNFSMNSNNNGSNVLTIPATSENPAVSVSKIYDITTTGSGDAGGEMEYNEIDAAFSITVLFAFLIVAIVVALILFRIILHAFRGPYHNVYDSNIT